jgi:hypothetical protein
VTLDERERLERGIVHARRDLRALLRPCPLEPLGVALLHEPPEQRRDDRGERDRDRARLQQCAVAAECVARVDEERRPCHHEHDTEGEARERSRTTPDEHDPARDQRARPEQRIREAETAHREEA